MDSTLHASSRNESMHGAEADLPHRRSVRLGFLMARTQLKAPWEDCTELSHTAMEN
jgi:hypothetical protein